MVLGRRSAKTALDRRREAKVEPSRWAEPRGPAPVGLSTTLLRLVAARPATGLAAQAHARGDARLLLPVAVARDFPALSHHAACLERRAFLQDWSPLKAARFAGLDNYAEMLRRRRVLAGAVEHADLHAGARRRHRDRARAGAAVIGRFKGADVYRTIIFLAIR